MKWARIRDGLITPRTIKGAAFLPTIFLLFGWNTGCKYRIIGIHRQKDTESVLLFNLNETEIVIPNDMLPSDHISPSDGTNMNPFTSGSKKDILAYPAEWTENFGSDYYSHAYSDEAATYSGNWNSQSEGQAYKESDINVTEIHELKKEIKEILNELKETNNNE